MPTLKDRFGLETDAGTDIKAGVWGMAGVMVPIVAQMEEGWPKWTLFTVFCVTMVLINYFTRGSSANPNWPLDRPDEDVINDQLDLDEPIEEVLSDGRSPLMRTLVSTAPLRTVSQKGINLIKRFEGCRLTAYWDRWGKVWTIGFGWTRGVKKGDVWTQAKAEQMLIEGMKPYAAAVQAAIGDVPTSQAAFDAMTSLAYNIGPGNFKKSSVLRFHRAGNKAAAANAFLSWTKAGGVTLPGLVTRRKAERQLYLS